MVKYYQSINKYSLVQSVLPKIVLTSGCNFSNDCTRCNMFLGVYMLLRVSAVIQDQRVVQALTLNFKEHFLRV